jgi:flagellar basal body-associated protein FliL
MNKTQIVIAAIILLGVVIGGYFYFSKSSVDTTVKTTKTETGLTSLLSGLNVTNLTI